MADLCLPTGAEVSLTVPDSLSFCDYSFLPMLGTECRVAAKDSVHEGISSLQVPATVYQAKEMVHVLVLGLHQLTTSLDE